MFTLENNCNYESIIPVRAQDTKEYSKRINKYIRKKVTEANSSRFNNFGKRYKSFAKAVGAQSKSNITEETS